jgi:hypothetical protein
MSIDTIVQVVIAIATTILVPGVYCLFRAINRNTEEIVQLKTLLTSGIEPRLDEHDEDIRNLYKCTGEHGRDIAVLKAQAHQTPQ